MARIIRPFVRHLPRVGSKWSAVQAAKAGAGQADAGDRAAPGARDFHTRRPPGSAESRGEPQVWNGLPFVAGQPDSTQSKPIRRRLPYVGCTSCVRPDASEHLHSDGRGACKGRAPGASPRPRRHLFWLGRRKRRRPLPFRPRSLLDRYDSVGASLLSASVRNRSTTSGFDRTPTSSMSGESL